MPNSPSLPGSHPQPLPLIPCFTRHPTSPKSPHSPAHPSLIRQPIHTRSTMTSSRIRLQALRAQLATERSTPWWLAIAFSGTLVTAVVLALYHATDSWLITVGLTGIFAAVSLLTAAGHARWLGSLAASRQGESICGFARSFPRRSVEPLLLRAVYEGIQAQMGDYRLPIRATDNLTKDLRLDAEEIDEVYWKIADTCGYSTDGGEQNPYYGKVETVADLVYFLQHQPR
jgi:hypothetical protein